MQAQDHIQNLFATEDSKHARSLASTGSGIETNHRGLQIELRSAPAKKYFPICEPQRSIYRSWHIILESDGCAF
jgi:hypothetical protein